MSGECKKCFEHNLDCICQKKEIPIEVGYQSVVINKMFGPLIFSSLRITADPKTNTWVVEREIIKTGDWVEWVSIPGQIDIEFNQDDDA